MRHIGVDIIEISRIEKASLRWGKSFLQRVFTEPELSLYQEKPSSLAARFAGKEAIIKALGKQTKSIGLREIEILSDPDGMPLVCLYGQAKKLADNLGLGNPVVTLSHSKEYAIAFALMESTV